MTTTSAPEALLKKLRGGSRFLLTSHANPDGDAIGSELGLARILRTVGKGAVIWNRDPTPTIYQTLAGSERVRVGTEPPAGFPENFDAVLVLECPSLDRTGLEEQLGEALPVVNIDHHLGNAHYGELNWVDTAAPSLGEMIYRLAQGLRVNLDQETATCLYLTLVTDTGGFRFANATPKAFEAAAALVAEGAQPDQVAGWIYENQPESSLRLLAKMLATLEVAGPVATALLTAEMFESTGASSGDSEGLIDYPRSIAGVQAVALLREVGDDQYKVSLRSRGAVDVEKIARKKGGGGHHNAAGYQAEGDLETLRREVTAELAAALES